MMITSIIERRNHIGSCLDEQEKYGENEWESSNRETERESRDREKKQRNKPVQPKRAFA